MAQTVKFDGCNARLGPPKGVTEEQCATIELFKNDACFVSAWKLTPEELAEINRTGLVWQSIWSNGLPPSFIGSETTTHALVADFGAVWPLSHAVKPVANCKICDKPMFRTPSGLVCDNGHGGAEY